MKRRKVLDAAGMALSTPFVGCLGGSNTAGDGKNETDDDNEETESEPGDDTVTNPKEVEEDPRVDEPPHEIEEPDEPDDLEDPSWNEEYLGENIDPDPSVSFDRIPVPRGYVQSPPLGPELDYPAKVFRVEVVTNEDDFGETFDVAEMDEELRDRLNVVDFDASVIVLVETGLGSSSVEHRWVRVEEVDYSLHLHGYYTDPYEQHDDIDTRFSVLEIERPATGFEFARVSLTINAEQRGHFNSTEGDVVLEK